VTTPTQTETHPLPLFLSELSALRESLPGMPELPEREIRADVRAGRDGSDLHPSLVILPDDIFLAMVRSYVWNKLAVHLFVEKDLEIGRRNGMYEILIPSKIGRRAKVIRRIAPDFSVPNWDEDVAAVRAVREILEGGGE